MSTMTEEVNIFKKMRELHQQEVWGLKKELAKSASDGNLLRGAKQVVDEAYRTIHNLEDRIAELLEVNENHQKLNGKLQTRVTEVEEDNQKLAAQIEDKINQMRKSGL
jgi:predicted  nucleic acid-binding Zn-ribbon protein|tara:strand:- start:678 stop:1001 length:324 start_codon:yes stop_codon:yes gene_type:complete